MDDQSNSGTEEVGTVELPDPCSAPQVNDAPAVRGRDAPAGGRQRQGTHATKTRERSSAAAGRSRGARRGPAGPERDSARRRSGAAAAPSSAPRRGTTTTRCPEEAARRRLRSALAPRRREDKLIVVDDLPSARAQDEGLPEGRAQRSASTRRADRHRRGDREPRALGVRNLPGRQDPPRARSSTSTIS